MQFFNLLAGTLFVFASQAYAQCGSGTPAVLVESSGSTYTAMAGSEQIYSGTSYHAAIQTALDSLSAGERLSVLASGSIGTEILAIPSGAVFEVCGAMDVAFRSGRGSIESIDTTDVQIPYLTMTGSPYFGLRFSGTKNLHLGDITMDLSDGLAIRFDRDAARNENVSMDSIKVTGAGSHAVEVWNIDGLEIGEVIATDVGECGLLIQASRDVNVGYVEGVNAGTGTGYATLRFANQNGMDENGGYETNIFVDKVYSRGGGRGVFCVSESGGTEIGSVDLAENGGNAVLIENCYNFAIVGGTVNGGGEVRMAAREEFANSRDVAVTLKVDGTSVREQPCGENTTWVLTGDGSRDIC